MFALIELTPWHWAGFIGCVLVFLALDLGLFHRRARIVRFREALSWSALWVTLALAFATLLSALRGREESVEFITGYVIELSLSLDNVFVIALIFSYFRIPAPDQHRVLFWGILGALGMRGALIGAGAALLARWHWVLYALGALVVVSGVKMLFTRPDGVHPERNLVVRGAQRLFPISEQLEGQKFLIWREGRRMLTPLTLVLLMVETTDLLFALDSIPAIFTVTTKPFIVFTSNVFAILGLRSMYFVLAGAIDYFHYLKSGLALVLVFVGTKLLLAPRNSAPHWFQLEIPTDISLLVVAGILLASIILSLVTARRGSTPGN